VSLPQFEETNFKAKVRFEWASGWYNGQVKWIIMEMMGWKVCNDQQYYDEANDYTYYVHIDNYTEGDNWLEYIVSGKLRYRGKPIADKIESGLGNILKGILVNLIKDILKIVIGLTITVILLSLAGQQLGGGLQNLGWGLIAVAVGILILIFAFSQLGKRIRRKK
jgi:hypothetical protein